MDKATAVYHWLRAWSAPEHQTMWAEIQTIATVLAFVAAYWLLRETTVARQTDLMLKLMEEYDQLRPSIEVIRHWYIESAEASADPLERFDEARLNDFVGDPTAAELQQSRHAVSRFFVKIRKLAKARMLNERVIVAALSREAVEDVFLKLVDPLDQVISKRSHGRPNITDKKFYEQLAKKYPRRQMGGRGRLVRETETAG